MAGDMLDCGKFGVELCGIVVAFATRLPIALSASVATFLALATSASATSFQLQATDAKNARLRDAVVSLRPTKNNPNASRARLAVSPTPIVIEQQDREFIPRVTVIAVGSKVAFPNNDSVPHSVYSFSAAKQFEFEVYVGTSPQVLTFDKVGVVSVGCNIHDWMAAYIVVVDTPYAAVTDASGSATFAELPDGEYELRLWHPQQKKDYVTTLAVGSGNRIHRINVDVSPPRVRYKPPLTVKPY